MTTTKTPSDLVAAPPAAPRSKSPGVLARLNLAQKLLLASAITIIPLAATAGMLGYSYWQEYRDARSRALATSPYAQLEGLQQNLRLMRGNSVQTITPAMIQGVRENAANLKVTTAALQLPEITALSDSITKKSDVLLSKIAAKSLSPDDILTLTGEILNGDLLQLFSRLSSLGNLDGAGTVQGRKLAEMSSETLPVMLPKIGRLFAGLMFDSEDIRTKQQGKPTAAQVVALQDNLNLANDLINQWEAKVNTLVATDPALNRSLSGLFKKTIQDTRNSFNLIENGLKTGKVQFTLDQTLAISDIYLDTQYKAFNQTVKELNRTFAESERTALNRLIAMLVASALTALLLIVLLRALTRSIARPLAHLTDGARRLSRGELLVHIPVESSDELGTLTQTFNSAADQLRQNAERVEQERADASRLQNHISELLEVTREIADGDLTKRGKVTGDVLGNVADSINVMTEELSGLLNQVQAVSASVSNGSQAMLNSTDAISQQTNLTSNESVKLAQRVQTITQTFQQMSQSAQKSAQTAKQAMNATEQGQEAINGALNGMQTVRREVRGLSERIKALGERSKEIQEIADTVSHISRQTHLLSLNASVEAAGAGEAGARFNAVAEEVRQLANSSGLATARIASMIKTVQAEIQDLIAGMEQGNKEVEEGFRTAGQAGEHLREINTLNQQAAQLADDIAQSSQMQVSNVEQFGSVVQQISLAAQASQESVQQGRLTAEQLAELAQELNARLSRFRLQA